MAVARVTEIVASSKDSFDDAVKEGLRRAARTLRGITGMEITSFKVKVDRDLVVEYRVTLKITFVLED